MHSDNWDDLRFVLAVAEAGSVAEAARRLQVNHATVLRRIAAFEDRHGASVFEKTARGYEVRPDKRRVIEAARDAEAAVATVARLLHGEKSPMEGVVRLTTTDTFSQTVMPEVIGTLRRADSGLRIELITTAAHLDFARLRADIAVRPAARLPEDLVGEIAAELAFAVYAPRGDPEAGWLGNSGFLAHSVAADWMRGRVPPEDQVGSADSFVVLAGMVGAGMGRAVLPCILGDREAGAERVGGVIPEIAVPVWVASHVDLANSARLKSVRRAIVEALEAHRDALAGRL